MIHFAIIALLQAQQPPPPRRGVPDPGVVATGQRLSPASVQSSFDGRVAGVRFGSSTDELWVAVPGATYRLGWRGNRAISRVRVDGTPGVYGVAVDPISHRVIVSSVGRLP